MCVQVGKEKGRGNWREEGREREKGIGLTRSIEPQSGSVTEGEEGTKGRTCSGDPAPPKHRVQSC